MITVLATAAVFAVLHAQAGAASTVAVPPPGGLLMTTADRDDAAAVAAALPYDVESVSILDSRSSRFHVYIPGAPAMAHTLDPDAVNTGAVVWIRRSNAGGGPDASAGVPAAIPATGPDDAAFTAPAPGGLTAGVVHASSLDALIAAQEFPVDSVFVWDVLDQEYRRFRIGAPAHVNALLPEEIAPGTVVLVRRALTVVAATVDGGSGARGRDDPSPAISPVPGASPASVPWLAAPARPTTPAPVAPSGAQCQAVPVDRLALLDEATGFAAHVTGGATGCVYHVTNNGDSGPGSLRAGAEAGNRWVVFDDDFTITLHSPIQVAANTTIDGRGRAITITKRGLYLSSPEQDNVILENLTLKQITGSDNHTGHDAVRAWNGASDFWFDHLTIEDVIDEYIDIGRTNHGRTTPVNGTISHVRFNPGSAVNTDEKALIVGAPAGADTNHLIQVTLHHNFYNGTRQRHPLAAGSKVHSFNNVIRWRLWGSQARREAGASTGANLVSEGDVFDASLVHAKHEQYGLRLVNSGTHVRIAGALLLEGAGVEESEPDRAFVPPYPYPLTSASEALATVPATAGAR